MIQAALLAVAIWYAAPPSDFELAWQLAGQMRFEEAAPILKRIVSADTHAYPAAQLLAEISAADLPAAETYFTGLIERDPRHSAAHYGLAAVRMARGEYRSAMQSYVTCAGIDRSSPYCYLGVASALGAGGERYRAREYVRAVPWYGDEPAGAVGLAAALMGERRIPEMVKVARGALLRARALNQQIVAANIESAICGVVPYEEQLGMLRSALLAAEDEDDFAFRLDVVDRLAQTLIRHRELDAAEHLVERYLSIGRSWGHVPWQCRMLVVKVQLQVARGEYDAALATAGEIPKLWANAGRQDLAGVELVETCRVLRSAGRFHEALACYEKRLPLDPSPGGQAFGLRMIALARADLGDYFGAIRAESQSIRVFEQQGMIHQAGASYGNLALHYAALGEYETAIRLAQRSLASSRRLHDSTEEQRNLANIGVFYLRTGHPGRALRSLEQSLAIAQRTHHPEYTADAYLHLGAAYAEVRKLPDAIAILEKARKLARECRSKRLELEAAVELGGAHLQAGHTERAQQLFEEGLRGSEVTGFAGVLAAARRGLGEVCIRKHHYRQALDYLGAAVQTVEELRARVPSPELRAGLIAQNWNVFHDTVDLLAAMDRLQPGAGYARLAFAYAERGRARAFLDTLSDSDGRVEAAGAEKAALRTGVTVVAFTLGNEASYAWTITGTSVTMFRLSTQSRIERAVRKFRASIAEQPTSSTTSAMEAAGRELYDLLLAPLNLPAHAHLVIVPDGILNYVPFEALTDKDGSYFIRKHVITYSPSVSAFAALSGGDRNGYKRDLLAVGDPVAAAGGPEADPKTALAALPNSRLEVHAIGALFPPARRKLLLGADATEPAFKAEQLRDYSRIHIAAHTVVNESRPSRSGVVLRAAGSDDGLLQADEIARLRIRARLVVLSGCDTGLGKLIKGEGVTSLARAFLTAGASRVSVSLWKVNDAATASLMSSFYRALAQGQKASAALRSAKLAMLDDGPPAWRHPYFWAPFVLIGGE